MKKGVSREAPFFYAFPKLTLRLELKRELELELALSLPLKTLNGTVIASEAQQSRGDVDEEQLSNTTKTRARICYGIMTWLNSKKIRTGAGRRRLCRTLPDSCRINQKTVLLERPIHVSIAHANGY